MATAEAQILMRLALLAEQCGEQVSEARAEFMARRLVPLGTDAVCRVLEDLLETARKFPTVGEVKAAMGVSEPTDEDKAREVAERLWGAISKYGRLNSIPCVLGFQDNDTEKPIYRKDDRWERITAYIGPIGEEVAKLQGGWNRICDVATNDNATTLRAQWRELAIVLIKKQRRGGDLDTPPDFGALPQPARKELKSLEARFTPYKDD